MTDSYGGSNGRRNGSGGRRGGGRSRRGGSARTVAVRRAVPAVREPVTLPGVLSVAELADKIETPGPEVIRELMKIGIMAPLNQQIDYDTAAKVATALGWETNQQEIDGLSDSDTFEKRRQESD